MGVTAGALTVNYFTRVSVKARSPLSVTLFAILLLALLVSAIALARYHRHSHRVLTSQLLQSRDQPLANPPEVYDHVDGDGKDKDGDENDDKDKDKEEENQNDASDS